MGYNGVTFNIPGGQGGFTHNPNIDEVESHMMVEPSKNINLNENGRGKRGGTAKINVSAGYGNSEIMGGYDFILTNGNQFQVVVTANGKIWKDPTTAIHTGWTINSIPDFEVMNNSLYIFNGNDTPQVWDGVAVATTDLANIPTDWTGSNFPFQVIKHGKGNSERLWALLGNNIYASKLNNGIAEADFSDAEVKVIYIETGDGIGLTGGIEFGDRLITFSKRKSYIVDDNDTDTANWGYETAQWDGGVANHRLLIKTPNDLVCMMDNGDIYSVIAAQEYGDYKAASLTRPAFIDRWIRQFIKRGSISEFHAIYNPVLRAIDFFMIRSGEIQIDMALRYWIDRGPLNGWMPQDNRSVTSGFNASCSFLVRESAGVDKVYTGDYVGFLWELETETKSDDGNGYYGGFKTPNMTFDNIRFTKKYRGGWLVVKPEGNYTVSLYPYIDGMQKSLVDVSLAGAGSVLDSFLLDTDVLGGAELIDSHFDIGERGKRIAFEVFNVDAGEDFYISSMQFDFKYLGARAS